MAHRHLIVKLKTCTKFSTAYLENVINNSFNTKESSTFYIKSKKVFPLEQKYLFAENDEVIEEIAEEADENLDESDTTEIKHFLFLYNLMTLIYNISQRENLETCCDLFLNEVFKYKQEFEHQAEEFDIKLRCYAMRYSLTQKEIYDLDEEIDVYFPSEELKALLNEMIEEGVISFTTDFNPQELDNAIIKLVKEVYRVSGERVPDVSTLPSNAKRSIPIDDEDDVVVVINKKPKNIQNTDNTANSSSSTTTGSSSKTRNPFASRKTGQSSSPRPTPNPTTSSSANTEEMPRPSPTPSNSTSESTPRPTTSEQVGSEARVQCFRKVHEPWTEAEIDALKRGLEHYQCPNWVEIKHREREFLGNRTNIQLKDKAKTEVKKLHRKGITEWEDLGVWRWSQNQDKKKP